MHNSVALSVYIHIYIYIYILEIGPASRDSISSVSRAGVLGVIGRIVFSFGPASRDSIVAKVGRVSTAELNSSWCLVGKYSVACCDSKHELPYQKSSS